jgi:hypothetical protein
LTGSIEHMDENDILIDGKEVKNGNVSEYNSEEDDEEDSDSVKSSDEVSHNNDVSIGDGKNEQEEVVETRVSTKDRLKQIARDERAQLAKTVKESKAKEKAMAKQKQIIDKQKSAVKDKSAVDEELVWEIEECKDVVYEECPAKKGYKKKGRTYLTCIRNAQKCKGWKMELLVEYNSGERQWSLLHAP